MAVPYPKRFKAKMIRRLTGPNPVMAASLAEETGVHQTTLSRWLREADGSRLVGMSKTSNNNRKQTKNSQPTAPRRPQDWSVEEKLQVLLEVATMSDEKLGAYLRHKGLHEAQLEQWQASVTEALSRPKSKGKKSRAQRAEQKRIRELERELKRKEKALAETAALLVLKKKAAAIWGDGDDDTDPKNDR